MIVTSARNLSENAQDELSTWNSALLPRNERAAVTVIETNGRIGYFCEVTGRILDALSSS